MQTDRAVLGRGLVLGAGDQVPGDWAGAPLVRVGPDELADPAGVVTELYDAWAARRPVVVELAVDQGALRAAETCTEAPYALTPDFGFGRERLLFLVWANNYDGRSGSLVWWHGRKAARRWSGEGVTEGGPADVRLPDGSPAFLDGGPADPPPVPSGWAVIHRWSAEAGALRPARRRPPSAALAPDQLRAVAHGSGPARVVAPAGSGKTRVLTERLRHLVVDRGVEPSAVTVLAYNTKAADELKTRCADFLTPAGPSVRTLNSAGLAICQRAAGGGRLRVVSEIEVRDLIGGLFEIRRRTNTDTVLPYIEALSAVRLGLRTPGEAEAAFPDATGIAGGFDRYRRALADAGAVDFDEQIYRAVEILLTDPAARARAQAGCRHLLVDEFQDLTPAHLLLIRLLCAPAGDCFGVGDDDQVLYGYSGATPRFLMGFSRYFPGAAEYALEVNYRCPPAVVGAAGRLLSYNERRVAKVIRPAPGRTDDAGALVVGEGPAEEMAGRAVDVVTGWRSAGGTFDEMAVLARVNSALLPVQVALAEGGIPYSSSLTGAVLDRTGARTAFAYLRIGGRPDRIDRRDLLETVRRPSRGIAPMVVDMLTRGPSTSVADIRRLAGRLSGRDVAKLEAYAADLDTVARACTTTTAAALRAIRTRVGLGETMDTLDSSRPEADRSTHADDLLALESVAPLHPDVATFEPWLRSVLGRPQPDGPAVLLSTVHRIKGREWDRVVVYGASQGLLPHRLASDEEEERRVFHVALTRARVQAVVLADEAAPSIFLSEVDGTRPHGLAAGRRPAGLAGPRSERRGARGPERGAERGGRGGPSVVAEVGLVLSAGGQSGPICELTGTGAVLAVGPSRVTVPYGADVTVRGRVVTLERPRAGSDDPVVVGRRQVLRDWRSTVARVEGVPAYVVLSDRDLDGVAEAGPRSLRELARCRGIGPVKLERWGDEILSLLEQPEKPEQPESSASFR